MLKKTIVIGSVLVGMLATFIAFQSNPHEFSFELVAPSDISHQRWEMKLPFACEEQETKRVLSKRFSYVGCGAQAYVFFSEDGSSVLKLFKKKRFKAPQWVYLLPPISYKAKKIAAKRANLLKDFTSYQIAFNKLQKETGLLLVHLDSSSVIDHPVMLMDHRCRSYNINLNKYVFIIQKRGELVEAKLNRLMKKGNIIAAKDAISSLLHLLKDRCNKGVADRDPNFFKNFAFIDNQAVQIDIGRFSHANIQAPRISKEFKNWLYNLSPELLEYFEKEYQSIFKP